VLLGPGALFRSRIAAPASKAMSTQLGIVPGIEPCVQHPWISRFVNERQLPTFPIPHSLESRLPFVSSLLPSSFSASLPLVSGEAPPA